MASWFSVFSKRVIGVAFLTAGSREPIEPMQLAGSKKLRWE